jgi:ribonucleoside-diphosphate reductase alpha chain
MREKLNNRRANETVTFQTQGHRYVATVSRFPDGRIAELFLNGEKASSELDAAARDAAIVFSMAMQYPPRAGT